MVMETYMKILLFIYFVVLMFLSSQISDVSFATNTISINQPLTGDQAIVSKGGFYELGFFKPDIGSGKNDRVYLGIWFKELYRRTYVWVANHKYFSFPEIYSSDYILMISNGNLILRNNYTGGTFWSTGVKSSKSKDVQAVLLDSGNLVLRDGNTSSAAVLWQSFDHPTDTWFPGGILKLVNPLLTSWKNTTDPSAGRYTLEVDQANKSLITVWNGSKSYWSSGPWDDRLKIYMKIVEFEGLNMIFELNLDESYITYSLGISDGYKSNSVLNNTLRLVLDAWGQLILLASGDDYTVGVWWPQNAIRCHVYNQCGSFGICDDTQSTQTDSTCRCVPGFRKADDENSDSDDFSAGCKRETKLLCGKEKNTFLGIKNMKLAADPTTLVLKPNLVTTCSSTCLANCSCNAYAYDGNNCMMWTKDVFNLEQLNSSMGHTFFLKVAASNITTALVSNTTAPVNNTTAPSNQGNKKRRTIMLLVVLSSVLAAAFLVGFCCCIASYRRRKKSQNDKKQSIEILGGIIDDDGEHMYNLNLHDILAATNAFSEDNKLGEGGFGPVFKGKLPNGMDVAIKRLSRKSSQGLTEFKNEVVLIIKLQHKNLVRLLGYCVESDEKFLIYEYLSNKSLDFLLFDSEKGRELDWETRMKIVNGTTRGLQYLHEDSRLRIIHRDLKASNILLDDEMNPKISDFGTARIFGCKQINDSTQRIVGTFGYMSPEYALGGIFSEKSDIYSFGVVLLEIISGKKATRFVHNDQKHSLIAYAWESWCETNGVSIIDEALCGSYSLKEVMRCIHIALLCVQDHPNDRPTISQIVYMLSHDNDLPSPKQPTFSNVLNDNQQLVSPDYVFSINEVTQTELEA